MSHYKDTQENLIEILSVVLDRPIAFHPVFADLTGSVLAGLLLSQAVYWTKRAASGGWFYKTITQWEEETRLSRHEQETARKTLRKFSFWQEERRGVPAKMYFRVDLAALYSELINLKENTDAQSSLPESGDLDFRKAADKNAEKQQTGKPESGKHNKGVSEITTETTSKTTSTTPPTPLQTVPEEHGGRDFVERLFIGTVLQDADPGRIRQVAMKYNRTEDDIETAIKVLNQQYRQSGRIINDPTALLVSALRDGIYVPEGHVSKAECEAEEPQRETTQEKADEKRREEESENAKYKAADEMLLALPEDEHDKIMNEAKARCPFILRNSKKAIWVAAREIIISRTKTASDFTDSDEAPRCQEELRSEQQ